MGGAGCWMGMRLVLRVVELSVPRPARSMPSPNRCRRWMCTSRPLCPPDVAWGNDVGRMEEAFPCLKHLTGCSHLSSGGGSRHWASSDRSTPCKCAWRVVSWACGSNREMTGQPIHTGRPVGRSRCGIKPRSLLGMKRWPADGGAGRDLWRVWRRSLEGASA